MKRNFNLIIILYLIATLFPGSAAATEFSDSILSGTQNTSTKKFIHKIGFDIAPVYVLPTSKFFRGENKSGNRINTHLSAHLKYGIQFGENTYFGRNYPHSVQGIGIAYNSFFNNSEMGSPVSLYVFQGSRIASLSDKVSLDYEWNFGASFGWKEYNEETNNFNDVVGSNTNAYINLGFKINWEFAPLWNLTAGIGLTHFSNGNTGYPNSGVNTLGLRLGVVRTLGRDAKVRGIQPQADEFKHYISYDLIVYGAVRKKGMAAKNNKFIVPGKFAVAGLNFNPMYNFNRYFRAGLSLDVQYDESANIFEHAAGDGSLGEDTKYYRPSFREQFSIGFSLRGEIVMPIFSINVGIGKNFLCKGKDTNSFYQIFALKTHITKSIFLHVGYQLYKFKEPNNLMLGLGYRFNAR